MQGDFSYRRSSRLGSAMGILESSAPGLQQHPQVESVAAPPQNEAAVVELRGVKMSTSDADISLLWGRAAGHCSYPGCPEDCSVYLKKTGHTILGEMAHVIARSAAGPRGAASVANRDGYENLILLCPTHHTLVDKAPADFPAEELTRWKAEHEARVNAALTAPIFSVRKDLYDFAARLLSQNGLIHGSVWPRITSGKGESPQRRSSSVETKKSATR